MCIYTYINIPYISIYTYMYVYIISIFSDMGLSNLNWWPLDTSINWQRTPLII